MRRCDTNVTNTNKLLVRSHTEVTEIRGEPKKDELNGYPIVVRVGDGRVRISIGFPTTSLKVDAKRVRRDLTKNFISRKFTSDKNHDRRLEREVQ